MNSRKLKNWAVAAIAAGVVCFAGPAMGDEPEELKGKSVKISYDDLNVEKEAGAQALYRRLQHAAKTACGVQGTTKSKIVSKRSESARCYRNVLDAAVERVDVKLVSQIHENT